MAIIAVTRLRLRDRSFQDAFFAASVGVLEQATSAAGNLGADAMAEDDDVWWTVTAWRDRSSMRGFVAAEPHASTMASVDEWCDEATFVEWTQYEAALPNWVTSHAHLVAAGVSADLPHATPENASRAFPVPATQS
jgi:hypothetical protein